MRGSGCRLLAVVAESRARRRQAALARVTVNPRASSWRMWFRAFLSLSMRWCSSRTEVAVTEDWIGKQVPDDDQDAGDGDEGFELSAA
ncbi:MAG: hypothetical protein ACM3ML_22990 [Micromonosporaceae bacterium]